MYPIILSEFTFNTNGIPTIHRRQFSVDNSSPTIHRRKILRRKIHRRRIHRRKIHRRKIYRRKIHRRKIHRRKIHRRKIHRRKIHRRKIHRRKIHRRKIHRRKIHRRKILRRSLALQPGLREHLQNNNCGFNLLTPSLQNIWLPSTNRRLRFSDSKYAMIMLTRSSSRL